MNFFNIQKVKDVFKLFERTDFNTYGVLFTSVANWRIYSGNFWWAKSNYLKTLNIDDVIRNRFNAETNYIQMGEDWKPYSPYNKENKNHYLIDFNEIGYK